MVSILWVLIHRSALSYLIFEILFRYLDCYCPEGKPFPLPSWLVNVNLQIKLIKNRLTGKKDLFICMTELIKKLPSSLNGYNERLIYLT